MATGRQARVFEPSRRDVPYRRAIIVGITGASFSGKTYSALRLAMGFKRALGGKVAVIDTDADRSRHYEEWFEFEHVPFAAPYSPLDYIDAIESTVARGATIVVVDHMTYEHDGKGGVLDQIETFMLQKEAEYADKGWNFNREQFNFTGQIKPKRERRELNQRIVQLSKDVIFILCYQAGEKIRPRKKGEKDEDGKPIREPEVMGWQPITTSTLPRDMTVRFLLTPACEGVPMLLPPNPAERTLIKQPRQFKDWFKEGEPLSEDMGESLARWAMSTTVKPATASAAPTLAEYEACATRESFDALEKRRGAVWKAMPPGPAKSALKDASERANTRLTAPTGRPDTIDSAIAALRACGDESTRAATWNDIQAGFEAIGQEVPPEVEHANALVKEQLKL